MQLCIRFKNVGAIEVAQKIPYDQITVGDIPHVAFEVARARSGADQPVSDTNTKENGRVPVTKNENESPIASVVSKLGESDVGKFCTLSEAFAHWALWASVWSLRLFVSGPKTTREAHCCYHHSLNGLQGKAPPA